MCIVYRVVKTWNNYGCKRQDVWGMGFPMAPHSCFTRCFDNTGNVMRFNKNAMKNHKYMDKTKETINKPKR